jgi:diacylglycerol O-acyltransferase
MTSDAAEPLSFDDAQILSLESDAIKGHTGKLLVLEPANGTRLTVSQLRERVAERLSGLPRLRQRVDLPPDGGPVWVSAEEVDLDWHVAEPRPGQTLDEEGFRGLAGEILAERLDHGRPLWRLDAIALEGNRTGLVGRIHHAMADGVSAIQIAAGLLWDQGPTAAGRGMAPQRPPGGGTASPSGGATSGRPVSGAPGSAGRFEAERPGGPLHKERPLLVRLPGALRRELRPGADTPLDEHIGSAREIAWTVFPLERLKGIGHATGEGITVNDVVLAAVAGGLRRWLEGHGSPPASLRVQIPVCLHLRDGDGEIGNKDSFLNVDLPLSEPDPLERLRSINAETTERKLDHDADTLYDFFHALGRFGPLYRGITRVISGPREFALSVSNVPGPRERPLICGHEVREFCSFAEPADRHALRVAVISLGGDLAFGLCSDPEAIGELNRLADSLEDSVAELEAASVV